MKWMEYYPYNTMTVEEFNSLSESQQIAIINSKGKPIGELKDLMYSFQLYISFTILYHNDR